MGRLEHYNILVTGGMGFVGSHLVSRLIGYGAHVFVLLRSVSPFSFFATQSSAQSVTSVICDVNDKERLFEVVTKYEITHIIHLAAQPLVGAAYLNPSNTIATNVMGTVNVLECARLFPHVKGVIVASSDKAYGKKSLAYVEGDPLSGDHPYDVSKSAADLIAYSYFSTYHVPVVITRFGNIYGEGDLNFSRIIPGALKSILCDEELEIRSSGKLLRDYLYVGDVVDGYVSLLENFDRVKGEAFNFGSYYNVSVVDLLRDIEHILRTPIRYIIKNTAVNEIPQQQLDWNKSKRILSWEPTSHLQTVLPIMYEWYRDYFKKKGSREDSSWIDQKSTILKTSLIKSGTIFSL